MRVVALVSGGKDSCYNMLQCVQQGHQIVALANLKPRDGQDELDSYMYQTVGHQAIELYSEAMGLPLYRRTIQGSAVEQGKVYKENENDEVEDLYELLKDIQKDITFDAVSSGALFSDYQRVRVEHVCSRLGLSSLAFLWCRNQRELLQEMISSSIDAIIIKVAALGLLPKMHLGMSISQIYPHMCTLSSKYGLNICGEGGEYETFTLDCPLFRKKIVINESEVVIHSDDAFAPVGFLVFKSMHLEEKTSKEIHAEKRDTVSDQSRNIDPRGISSVEVETVKTGPDVKWQDASSVVKIRIPAQTKLGDASVETRHRPDSEYLWIANITGHCGKESGMSIEDAAKHLMAELTERLHSLQARPSDIVMTNLFMNNLAAFSIVNSIYKTHFPSNPPARACVQIDLPEDTALQMDCLVYKAQPGTAGNASGYHTREAMHVQSISHWAPANIGPYSQANKVGKLMFVSGIIGLHPASMTLVNGGIEEQAKESLKRVHSVISAFSPGTTLNNLLHGFCYVTQTQHIPIARQIWQTACASHQDSSEDGCPRLMSFVAVPSLPKGALVEWQVVTHASKHGWDYCHNSVRRNGFTWTTEQMLSSSEGCAVLNCFLGFEESQDRSLGDIMDCFALELSRVANNEGMGHAVVTRIFYMKTIFIYARAKQFIEEHFNQIGFQEPFTLIPVEGLQNGALMQFSCLFMGRTPC